MNLISISSIAAAAIRGAKCRRGGSSRFPLRRIKAGHNFKLDQCAVAALGDDIEHLARCQTISNASDSEGEIAVETESLPVLSFHELQRQNAHADQIAAVNALEAFGNDGFNTEQRCSLGRPVTGAAGAVFLAGDDDQRNAFFLYFIAAS